MKGYCAVCRGWYALKQDGKVRKHERYNVVRSKYGAGPSYVPCEGAGKKPVNP